MAAGENVKITMPEMGESVSEGTVLTWLKKEGEWVDKDETVVEVSTDKVDAEIPSPAAGKLAKILVGEDEVIEVGGVLGELEVGAEAPAESSPEKTAPAEPQRPPREPMSPNRRSRRPPPQPEARPRSWPFQAMAARSRLSPAASLRRTAST